MKMFRSVLGYAALAIAAMLSCVGLASATEKLVAYHYGRQAVAKVGGYGESVAKFKTEQAYQAGISGEKAPRTGSLTKQSHGFVLSNLVKAISGVAGGKIGVGAGAALA